MKIYLCIDLKTFYASVECSERNLDPFITNLVVADPTRSKSTICLAITPAMKEKGIKNRCRILDIPKNVNYIVAKPRMKKYIEYSAKIYSIYLKYIDKNDIHIYSIDEAFLDVTDYLSLYKTTPVQLAKIIMNDIYNQTKITATAGIGTNLYLAKIALDITAKHVKNNIGFLTEEIYKNQLWHHLPLTDFWQIGTGIEKRLNKLKIKDMYDIANTNPKILYKEFGINAELLIDHSKGIETCTIEDIKKYKSKTESISSGQVLFKNYNYKDAKKVLIEMIDNSSLELVKSKKYAGSIFLYIGYSKNIISPFKISLKLNQPTNSYQLLKKEFLKLYDLKIDKYESIRRINIGFGNLEDIKYKQLDIFNTEQIEIKDNKIEEIVNNIKNKYGKNAILRGVSYLEESTGRERNKLIGGHNAE